MTTAAIVFMVLSVSSVGGLAAWCYYRVLTTPPKDDAENGDVSQADSL